MGLATRRRGRHGAVSTPAQRPRLRLGVNGAFLTTGRGGMGTFARSLLRGLLTAAPEIEIVLYCPREARTVLLREDPWTQGIHFVDTPTVDHAVGQRVLRMGTELAWLPGRARRDGIDVLHHAANIGPPFGSVPSVLTVHDLMWRHYPSTHPASSRAMLSLVTPAALRAADRVTTVSRHSARDIEQAFRLAPGTVTVIPPGPGKERTPGDAQAARARHRLGDRPVLLSMGVGFENKNIARLLEAFARVGPARDLMLVHTGGPAVEGARWQALAHTLGISDRVRFPGYESDTTDQEVEDLFAAATALVHPSLFEGFGLPLVEAMRRGVPVAAADRTALPEVGGDAVLWFDPTDVGAIADAIARLADEPALRDVLIANGLRQAATFSWEHTAARYASIYHELAGHPAAAPTP